MHEYHELIEYIKSHKDWLCYAEDFNVEKKDMKKYLEEEIKQAIFEGCNTFVTPLITDKDEFFCHVFESTQKDRQAQLICIAPMETKRTQKIKADVIFFVPEEDIYKIYEDIKKQGFWEIAI